MDPDANLEEQRRLASRLMFQVENDKPADPADVLRLTELVVALDGWISDNGALPSAWRKQ